MSVSALAAARTPRGQSCWAESARSPSQHEQPLASRHTFGKPHKKIHRLSRRWHIRIKLAKLRYHHVEV
eukprot:8527183-Pyramimonas_sp.AAC.1